MKVSTVLSVAFTLSGFAQAEYIRGKQSRKLAHINEDGLTKRQQRKKEIAEEADAGNEAVIVTLDEVFTAGEEEVMITLDEIDVDTGVVEEEVSVTVDLPETPSTEDKLEEEVESMVYEPRPEHKKGKKNRGKGKGKSKGKHGGRTKDLKRDGEEGPDKKRSSKKPRS